MCVGNCLEARNMNKNLFSRPSICTIPFVSNYHHSGLNMFSGIIAISCFYSFLVVFVYMLGKN